VFGGLGINPHAANWVYLTRRRLGDRRYFEDRHLVAQIDLPVGEAHFGIAFAVLASRTNECSKRKEMEQC